MTAKKKIIIVDDDPGFLKMLKMRIELEGYDCEGHSAAFVIDENSFSEEPDLIIIDRWLSDVDGIEWAGLIKENFPDLPVVIVTALKSIIKKPDPRFDRIHPKPIDWEVLLEDIEDLTDVIRLAPELTADNSANHLLLERRGS